ncbi:hypothetical protein [Streptomyces sp. NPDC058751]|uniref:hypothetical protein n=1 Tax=Streptomyces sp. NPDC058751 TaxID=3346623 RepID=UPI003678D5EC
MADSSSPVITPAHPDRAGIVPGWGEKPVPGCGQVSEPVRQWARQVFDEVFAEEAEWPAAG